MNFNASGGRQPTQKLGAKKLRPSMNMGPPVPGYPPQPQPPYDPFGSPPATAPMQPGPIGFNPVYDPPMVNNMQEPFIPMPVNNSHYQQPGGFRQGDQQFNMPNQFLSAAAMQYGEHLVGMSKQYMDRELEKHIPVSRLKYYFAVDTLYVTKKLGLLFFPFTQSDWSIKYSDENPVQPRFDVNAPDLYIPTMAYLTYVLVAGLALGTQDRFAPEVLGIQASSALAWTVLEILVHLVTLYIMNITTSLTTIDILAFCGYKFVGIIFAVLISLVFHHTGYYVSLIYFSVTLCFFLVRTLKMKVLPLSTTSVNTYGADQYYHNQLGNKRRLYFLLFIAGCQPVLMWWLSYHLL